MSMHERDPVYVYVCASPLQLNLERNQLGSEGAAMLVSAIAATASMTTCNLRKNRLGVEGWTIIFNTLRDSPTSKIATWNLYGEKLGPEIAKPLAEYISVTTWCVTKISVNYNLLGDAGATILCDALRESKVTKVQELDLSKNNINLDGVKAVVAMAAVVASLTLVR